MSAVLGARVGAEGCGVICNVPARGLPVIHVAEREADKKGHEEGSPDNEDNRPRRASLRTKHGYSHDLVTQPSGRRAGCQMMARGRRMQRDGRGDSDATLGENNKGGKSEEK